MDIYNRVINLTIWLLIKCSKLSLVCFEKSVFGTLFCFEKSVFGTIFCFETVCIWCSGLFVDDDDVAYDTPTNTNNNSNSSSSWYCRFCVHDDK